MVLGVCMYCQNDVNEYDADVNDDEVDDTCKSVQGDEAALTDRLGTVDT